MNNLIPHIILDKYQQKNYSGEFTAFTMFVDISGFTKMTQTLMKNGKEGAEVLTEIINQVFTPSIDAIYKDKKGFISTFAGDAFTAIFQNENNDNIIEGVNNLFLSAKSIIKVFKDLGLRKTKFGDFNLNVKIGLSIGNVEWRIIKSDYQNSYFFKGEAINNCANSEHNCSQGEIIFDKLIYKIIKNKEYYTFDKKVDNYFILNTVLNGKSTNLEKKVSLKKYELEKNTVSNFVPRSIQNLKTKGEFRKIVSCFISFDEKNTSFEKHITNIINLTNQFGGYFNKIDFGDKGGVMLILFGAPSGKEKIFKRATDFALAVRDLNNSNNPFKTRIGLTFGTAFTGFVGSSKRNEYTALGDVVNLSARFMLNANFNDINITKEITENINDNFKFISNFKFKGFSDKIPTYHLLEKRVLNTSKVVYKNKLIGRNDELNKLTELTNPIFDNKNGGIIYIDGIAGIGKTRFLWEFKNQNNRKGNKVNWFYMPCDEILKKSFNPIIYFLMNYFNQKEQNLLKENKNSFENKLNTLNRKIKDKEIKKELLRTKSILGGYLGIEWKNSLYSQLDGQGRYENFVYAIKNLIKAESLVKPLIIELDDGQWIDEDTRKLLDTLFMNTKTYPFEIISSCRFNDDGSNFIFSLNKNNLVNRINLEHFSKNDTKLLILELLAIKDFPRDTLSLIYNKSNGNPFFIEQIILYFIENKLFDNNYIINSTKFEIPSNINSVIIARIDRLKMELKEVIKTASVLGREFSVKILSKMLSDYSVDNLLLEGEKEVIWNVLSEIKYIFKHTLVRDTVYEMQLKKELKSLHKLAGENIESIYKNNIKNYYADLANHFEEAEILDKAIEYLEKAGDFAKDNYHNDTAISFYDRLLNKKFNHSVKKEIDISIKKAQIYELIGKWDEAIEILLIIIILCEKINDKKRIAKSSGFIGGLFRLKRNYKEAMISFNKQLKISNELNYKSGISRAKGDIGLLYYLQGNYDKAMENYEVQLKICKSQRNKRGISRAIGNIGVQHYVQGNYTDAMKSYKEILKIYEEFNDKRGISKVVGNIGIVYHVLGNHEKAIEYYERALITSEELGDRLAISRSIGNMGAINKTQGKFDEAMESFSKQLKIKEELGDEIGIARAVSNIGSIYRSQGNYAKALKSYKKELKIEKKFGDKQAISRAAGNLAIVLKSQGNYLESLVYLEKAMKIDNELNLNSFLPYHLNDKVNCLYLMGKYKDAKKFNKDFIKTATEMDDSPNIFQSKMLHEKIEFKLNLDNHKSKLKNIENLKLFLIDEKDESNIATLNYEIAIMLNDLCKDASVHKNSAINSFKKLYKEKPDIGYKKSIEELEKL